MEEMNKLLAKRWVSRLPKTHARQEAPAPQRVSVLAQPRGRRPLGWPRRVLFLAGSV